MKTHRFQLQLVVLIPALLLAALPAACAAETNSLAAPLEPLRPLLGQTWKGHFKDSTPEKPQYDVARWERALNGQAVRITHSVNDGVYGGESMILWDPAKKQVVYYYFTTAGFFTTGVMTFEGGRIVTRDQVTGNTNGITEVRSTYELRPDGTLLSKAEYLKGNAVEGGREVTYRRDDAAKVIFR